MTSKETFVYAEFCRGLSDRGNLVRVDNGDYTAAVASALVQTPDVPLFRSLYLYPVEAVEHVKKHTKIAGYQGQVWGDAVVIDVDDENLDVALKSARSIVTRLVEYFYVDHSAIEVAFSGKKGFHIVIPQAMVGFEPSPVLHKQMASFVSKVAGANLYDRVIYTPTRILRIAGSKHPDTKLYKIMLTAGDLLRMSREDIVRKAAAPCIPPEYTETDVSPELAAAWPLPNAIPEMPQSRSFLQESRTTRDDGQEIRKDQRMCIQKLMRSDVKPGGGRNNIGLRIASHFANLGTPSAVTAAIVDTWNHGLSDPLPQRELEVLTESALSKKYYFSCQDEILAGVCDKRCFKYQDEVASKQISPSVFKNVVGLSSVYIQFMSENRFCTFGVPEIDYHCRGIAPGEVGIIIGRSGVGKTTFMLHMAKQIREATKLPILILEQELHDFLIFEKSVALSTSCDPRALANVFKRCQEAGDLREFDVLVDQAQKQFEGIYYCTLDRLDTQKKIDLIKKFKDEFGAPAIVFEDFLGRGKEVGHNIYEQMSKMAQGLKSIAKECDVPYICLAQVSRGAGEDISTPLTINSARDSGHVEENCDYMFGLSRPKFGKMTGDDMVLLQILKSRRGHEGYDFFLDWDRGTGVYSHHTGTEVPATSPGGETWEGRA